MKKLLLITLVTGFMAPSSSVKAMDYVNRENIVVTSTIAGMATMAGAAIKYFTAGASESGVEYMHIVTDQDYKDLLLYIVEKEEKKIRLSSVAGFYKNSLVDYVTKNEERWNVIVSELKNGIEEYSPEIKQEYSKEIADKRYKTCQNINTTIKQQGRRNSAKKWFLGGFALLLPAFIAHYFYPKNNQETQV